MSSEAHNFLEGSDHAMTLLRILHSSQITLPAELCRQFGLTEGDYLEVQALKEGILLKPVNVMDRQKASYALITLLDRVHAKQSASQLSVYQQEEAIAQEVKAFRKEKHSKHHA